VPVHLVPGGEAAPPGRGLLCGGAGRGCRGRVVTNGQSAGGN
jgi:hypothetical protein